jgi:hypothetical protein
MVISQWNQKICVELCSWCVKCSLTPLQVRWHQESDCRGNDNSPAVINVMLIVSTLWKHGRLAHDSSGCPVNHWQHKHPFTQQRYSRNQRHSNRGVHVASGCEQLVAPAHHRLPSWLGSSCHESTMACRVA